MRQLRRWRACAAAAAAPLLVCGACTTSAMATPLPVIAPTQQTVVVRTTHVVRATPDARSNAGRVAATRPITGVRTVLPLLGAALDARGRNWYHVRLPGRANGERVPPRAGWIIAVDTGRSSTAQHLVVDRAGRRVLVYVNGRLRRTFRVIVGAPGTPTPAGAFFVEEGLRMPTGTPGAPYALATSARSKVLYEFDGGPGQIALHGMSGLSGTLGTAASHGCVRMSAGAITWLTATITAGVPVTIV